MEYTLIGMNEFGNQVTISKYKEPSTEPFNYIIADILSNPDVVYVEVHPIPEKDER